MLLYFTNFERVKDKFNFNQNLNFEQKGPEQILQDVFLAV